nr:MAG TPA: hypothetical protein [Caudoviricetes sp.]
MMMDWRVYLLILFISYVFKIFTFEIPASPWRGILLLIYYSARFTADYSIFQIISRYLVLGEVQVPVLLVVRNLPTAAPGTDGVFGEAQLLGNLLDVQKLILFAHFLFKGLGQFVYFKVG